jgi:hypothetical protein
LSQAVAIDRSDLRGEEHIEQVVPEVSQERLINIFVLDAKQSRLKFGVNGVEPARAPGITGWSVGYEHWIAIVGPGADQQFEGLICLKRRCRGHRVFSPFSS